MISELPDSLISLILSYLPTREAVRTSVLSHRWRSLWLLTPALDLDFCRFPSRKACVRFMKKFIYLSRQEKSCLHKLKLSFDKYNVIGQSCVTRWIDYFSTPKLEHLDVFSDKKHDLMRFPWERDCVEVVVPLSLYICEALSYLRLKGVMLSGIECVSLPCLKKICLEENIYANEACLELLISSCPILQDLSIVRRDDDNVKVLRVHSQTLTSLSIEHSFYKDYTGVLIDAPRLRYLKLEDCDMNGSDDEICNFFTSISGVANMNISWFFTEHIAGIMPFPFRFSNLSRLEAEIDKSFMQKLPMFLESCPILKSLILDIVFFETEQLAIFAFVPQCLLPSLEFVEIRCKEEWDPILLELARYFAENSIILKELSLVLRSLMLKENAAVLEDILALPTRSSNCRICC